MRTPRYVDPDNAKIIVHDLMSKAGCIVILFRFHIQPDRTCSHILYSPLTQYNCSNSLLVRVHSSFLPSTIPRLSSTPLLREVFKGAKVGVFSLEWSAKSNSRFYSNAIPSAPNDHGRQRIRKGCVLDNSSSLPLFLPPFIPCPPPFMRIFH